MKRIVTVAVISVLALIPVSLSRADTATTTFNVGASVSALCLVIAADLDFGAYNPLSSGTDLDINTTVTVECTNTTTYDVGLDVGTGTGATYAVRKMTSGANLLDYSLYSDAARTNVWGETIGVDTVAGTGDGTAQVLTVYGRVPSGQSSAIPGAYTDVITVTVTY